MLKALVKKQFLELFQSYFQNRKTGKARSRRGVIGMFFAFAAIMLFLCLVFGMIAFSLAENLLPDLGWLYFSLVSLISMFLGVFGSVFNTYSTLYGARDNEMLLAMPIPPAKLLASRLIGVYGLGLMYEAVVMLPAMVLYWIFVPVTAARILCPIALMLVLSLFILSLCCVLGWVVALIAARLKNKSFITVFVSLAFLALYYVFYFRANTYLQQIAQHTDEVARAMRSWLWPFYQMGQAGAGSWLSLLLVALLAAALFAVIYLVLSRSFLRIVTVNRGEKKAVYREKRVKAAGTQAALLRRELRRYTASATYMLNCSLGLVMMLATAVLAVIKAPEIRQALSRLYLDHPSFSRLLPVLLAGIAMVFVGMIDITAPSVSLEGRGLWLIQSLPVRALDVLNAKQKLHVLIALPVTVLTCLCVCIVMQMSVPASLLFTAVCIASVLLSSAGGLTLNLLRPNLTWTNEGVPVKQSMSVTLTLLGFWPLAAVVVVPYLFLRTFLSPELYLAIVAALLALAVAGLNLWLRRRGAAIFETL